jgi:quercetin dioxygenase-like cupin family protein
MSTRCGVQLPRKRIGEEGRRAGPGASGEITDDSAGQLTIVEVTAPPGLEMPLHVHHRDDEGFWILEVDVTFEVGDAIIDAHAGDYVFVPRDIPDRCTVGKDGCRMLVIMAQAD